MTTRLVLVCAAFLLPSALSAQSYRVPSLGDMTLAVRDSDHLLTPYDLGGNPAWLLRDETSDWLRVAPAAREEQGALHRLYDPFRVAALGVGFDGVKTLGERGTFRGSTSYGWEYRRDVYRSVERSPYAGEAFFLTDTTSGNFMYAGPTVQFMYSYELLYRFYLGAAVSYQLLNGLKDRYSQTKSLNRDLRATVGLACQPSDEWVLGLTFLPSDNQEALEVKSEEAFDVEVFNYRGETYASRQRGSSVDHKVRKKGEELGGQVYYRPSADLELALLGTVGAGRTRILVTKSLEKELEEGLGTLQYYDAAFHARYQATDELAIGTRIHLARNREWSRYTTYNLLLWDWRVREAGAAAGIAYQPATVPLLAGVEYEFAGLTVDSSKYIDARFMSATPKRHVVRAGLEYEAWPQTYLRLGYNYQFDDLDFLSGQKRVASHLVTAGGTTLISNSVELEAYVGYTSAVSRAVAGLKRSGVNLGLILKMLAL